MTNKLVKIVSMLIAFAIVVSGTGYAVWGDTGNIVPESERLEFFTTASEVVLNKQYDIIETGKPLYFEVLYNQNLEGKDAEMLDKFKATFKVSRIVYKTDNKVLEAGATVDASNHMYYSVAVSFVANDGSATEYVHNFHNIITASFKPVDPTKFRRPPRSVMYTNAGTAQNTTQPTTQETTQPTTQETTQPTTQEQKPADNQNANNNANNSSIEIASPYGTEESVRERHNSYVAARNKGLIKVDVTEAKVKAPVMRIELVDMLYNLEGNVVMPTIANTYTDIQEFDAVHNWALSTKLILGNEKGEFMPYKNATIQDTLLVAYRYLKMHNKIGEVVPVESTNTAVPADTSDYAKEAVTFFVTNGLTKHDVITSAKEAMTLERLIGIMAEVFNTYLR